MVKDPAVATATITDSLLPSMTAAGHVDGPITSTYGAAIIEGEAEPCLRRSEAPCLETDSSGIVVSRPSILKEGLPAMLETITAGDIERPLKAALIPPSSPPITSTQQYLLPAAGTWKAPAVAPPPPLLPAAHRRFWVTAALCIFRKLGRKLAACCSLPNCLARKGSDE
ncbi:hypothetical protein Vretimale_1855 [Volvox reticuliferus]|nr:hypothetical protein Vretimale_1855 [Volvox reticuliferus]